ncbi:ATP phosphoribosyltransferase regulatory subunit [Loktanella sp. DSM 29012]|uniref:ATP phosphoribosyltransferase regulatory subunit n=1 Tax=Loktanella sp. DSM 29012 TaxID=1881056 RepID=UPI0008BDAAE7|nr:ATP phosphoribosyltransferase regulatory subunit [Loktanella sp. DSM 29012]SEP77571.1 ATP phosphoribosyltransferase regulatory subunit [Loktanella sp. DSM 29012]
MNGRAIQAETDRLSACFAKAGAQTVYTDVLQPADTLLDLYGEDIRGRSYLTSDPALGEMVLRPDFTVPVVQMHMQSHANPARYTYAGRVFRKQDVNPGRATEFVQVGFEVMGGDDPAAAEAEVFATIRAALGDLPLRAATGDIGVLMAAVRGLRTTQARKDALMRHIWRPRRFRALLDRFGGRTPPPASRTALLALTDPLDGAPALAGVRTRAEIAARIASLREDAAAAPISASEIALLDVILDLRASAPQALGRLRDIAIDMPAIEPAVTRMHARLNALHLRGIDVDALEFEGSYGRTALEYYDGFVFGFYAAEGHQPPVATGGRYDALTARLGDTDVPAVGGVIRPDLVLAVRGHV